MSRVGLVLVSHSPALAGAALELARAMVPVDPPVVAIAAGTAGGELGTDPLRVAAALEEADSGSGVVVLSDLGSAVLSAEMALEFADPELRVALVAAPFVEGLVAALVSAAAGSPLQAVAQAARNALAAKVAHLETPDAALETGVEPSPAAPEAPGALGASAITPGAAEPAAPVASITLPVVNVGGMHARPAAAIAALLAPLRAVVQLRNARGEQADAASPIALGLLGAAAGDQLTATAEGEEAERALQLLQQAFAAGFGEERLTPRTAAIPGRGLGVSPGRVCAPVRRVGVALAPPAAAPPLASEERPVAVAALAAARDRVVADLRHRAAGSPGARAGLLQALASMAADPSLSRAASQGIAERGLSAEAAWWQTLSEIAGRYRAAGGRRAERACDLLDLRDRVVRQLRGEEAVSPDSGDPAIWLAEELAPADLASLPEGSCLGIVTESGGPTSHAAILARQLGIPAVTGAQGILGLADGTLLLLDGGTGELQVNPAPPQLEALQRAATASAGAASERATPRQPVGPCRLADGLPVALLANVSSPRDNLEAAELGADGVGLLRTEFCFPSAQQEPGVEEQSEHYASLLAAWPGRRVLIRSFDAGADKPLAWMDAEPEANPALGLRGFRLVRRQPQVLTRQLEAIAAAMRRSEAEVWVIAPMISTVAEARDFVAMARAAGLPRAGVMVETPAAALCAEELCGVVDGISLGTNDLLQYTMAADRSCAALADLSSPRQPALLRLIARVAEAGQRHGVPVSVCGEAAGSADLAPLLVGLGIRALSMAPRALPAVAAALRQLDLDTARAMAQQALAADGTEAPTGARQPRDPG
ncbi:MAG: dihydroxyacetone kinase phosphoryl donor subunit DhaM [Synechococcaceae cyanobacterium]|nr:dihydroxyacetone kinase phosphoryl donor subunit DhaM [Synechococcaceae cyanobacterium]